MMNSGSCSPTIARVGRVTRPSLWNMPPNNPLNSGPMPGMKLSADCMTPPRTDVAASVASWAPMSDNAPFTSPDLRPWTRPEESAPETFATAAASSGLSFFVGRRGFFLSSGSSSGGLTISPTSRGASLRAATCSRKTSAATRTSSIFCLDSSAPWTVISHTICSSPSSNSTLPPSGNPAARTTTAGRS
jgi:hypothetical protein